MKRLTSHRKVFRIAVYIPVAMGLAFVCGIGTTARGADIEFNRDIRPILAENCFACHGPDSAARKASLRLDVRDQAVEMLAIVPGKPDESHLLERIFEADVAKRMPPEKSHKKLTDVQKETLKKWIAAGAEYQPHWSFIPPNRPALPKVKTTTGWIRNPIDHFVLAELEKRGLQPAAEADRRTLSRRLSLDLIGLPPSPAEVDAFVNDAAPGAYERYVDRLLDSPHWGEHRGRYWLDYARYADTHGIHFDNFREMWTYRDWVINAFNRNMSFDQFTVEQLAGDLLPQPSLEQRIATGFNRCNITTNEGGAIDDEYLVLYTRDRTETASQVFLGLTTGCAVCHDHKFDPLIQREFYELAAFFNNTTQKAMDGNIKDTPPILPVPRVEDRARFAELSKELSALRQQADSRKQSVRPEFDGWLANAKPRAAMEKVTRDGLKFHALLSEGAGNSVTVLNDGELRQLHFEKPAAWGDGHIEPKALKTGPATIVEVDNAGDFDKDQAFSFGALVRLPKNGITGALFARMDNPNQHRGWDLWIEANNVGTHIIHSWPGDAIKAVSRTPLTPDRWHHVFVTYDGSTKVSGVNVYVNGQKQELNITNDSLKNTTRTAVPLKVGQRHTEAPVINVLIQDMRIYARALTGVEVDQIAKGTRATYLASKPADKRTDPEKNELFDWWLLGVDASYQSLVSSLDALEREEATIKTRGTVAYVSQEKPEAAMAHVLFRGEYDKRKDEVKPGTPAFLPPMAGELPRNRLGFAQWLLRPDHPLTTRVTVNRFWQELFGTGIVRTSGDFGISGELPSHPELLDWLAVEFRESGWDMKKFYKLLVTSATYRQAAVTTPEKLAKDAQNRFMSRGPRFRMDAEMIRDYALASSGIMVRKLGGPSVKPYQPDGVWEAVAMIGSNTRDYKRDTGEALYRRSMYTLWKRAAPPASMDILNAPAREVCTVRRDRTNTPLQALLTLNDVQFVEAARHLAQATLKEGGEKTETRLDFIAQRLLSRSLSEPEQKVVVDLAENLLVHYKAHPDEAKKLITVGESKPDEKLDVATLAAWTMVVNQLMNLDEALNK